MSKHPPEPYLFEVVVRNHGDPLIVRAGSLPEARNYVMDNFVAVKKLTPTEAFRAGRYGSPILNAKPEYSEFDEEADESTADPTSHASEVQHV